MFKLLQLKWNSVNLSYNCLTCGRTGCHAGWHLRFLRWAACAPNLGKPLSFAREVVRVHCGLGVEIPKLAERLMSILTHDDVVANFDLHQLAGANEERV